MRGQDFIILILIKGDMVWDTLHLQSLKIFNSYLMKKLKLKCAIPIFCSILGTLINLIKGREVCHKHNKAGKRILLKRLGQLFLKWAETVENTGLKNHSEFRRILCSKHQKVIELKLEHQPVTYVINFSTTLMLPPEVKMGMNHNNSLLQDKLHPPNLIRECLSWMAARDSSSQEGKGSMKMLHPKSSLREKN